MDWIYGATSDTNLYPNQQHGRRRISSCRKIYFQIWRFEDCQRYQNHRIRPYWYTCKFFHSHHNRAVDAKAYSRPLKPVPQSNHATPSKDTLVSSVSYAISAKWHLTEVYINYKERLPLPPHPAPFQSYHGGGEWQSLFIVIQCYNTDRWLFN